MDPSNKIDEWNVETLNGVIETGEGYWLEFKQHLKHDEKEDPVDSKSEWRHKIESEFTAFANAEGGRILFGVTDGGNPVGVPEPEESFNGFFNNLLSDTNPPPTFEVEWVEITDGRFVVIASVEEAETKPVQTSNAGYYVRINESAQPMNRELVQSRFLQTEHQFSARRDLEIQLAHFDEVYYRVFEGYEVDSSDPPHFSHLQTNVLRDVIDRYLRYGLYDEETEQLLRSAQHQIARIEDLEERYNRYVRSDGVAFEYGRRSLATGPKDYQPINQGTREDLKEMVERLHNQVRPLISSTDIKSDA